MEVNKSRTYFDELNQEEIYFFSNASQKVINALSLNQDWYTVKAVLINKGYTVIEDNSSDN